MTDAKPAKMTIKPKAKTATKPTPEKKTTLIQPKPKSKTVDKANELIEKEAKRKESEEGTLSIVEIANSINMDPKVARAKLRRKGLKSNEGRWNRIKKDSKDYRDLIDLLKGKTTEA